jgi:hypothetical protein
MAMQPPDCRSAAFALELSDRNCAECRAVAQRDRCHAPHALRDYSRDVNLIVVSFRGGEIRLGRRAAAIMFDPYR